VRAAAYEGPITEADAATLGSIALERAALLPELERTPAGWVWKGRDFPAARVSLRSGDTDAVVVVDAADGSVLGQVERTRSYGTVHPGAIYLHLGDQYHVEELDLASGTAVVRRIDADWYTQAKKESETLVEETLRHRSACGVELHFGRITVSEQVVGYQQKAIADGSTIALVPLDMPETSFETEAIWFCPGGPLLSGLDRMPRLLSSLHAAEHALIALLPLQAMCDRWDIGGLSTNLHFQTGEPTVFVYDGHEGGVGITERGFDRFEQWVADTAGMLAGCPCRAGCPSCVQSPKCGNLNEHLDKEGARTLTARMAGA
jgi:DEAD/DEAH box helicase domain-containing protein